MSKERTLLIIKPDALNRRIVGEVINRYERKGLNIIAMKMMQLTEEKVNEHYAHHVDKPFFASLKEFMTKSPAIFMVLEGKNAVEVVRFLSGETEGTKALPGTVRGDFALSIQNNIVHASDSVENAKREIARFFSDEELSQHKLVDEEMIYSPGERD